jgi:hypothetical protein
LTGKSKPLNKAHEQRRFTHQSWLCCSAHLSAIANLPLGKMQGNLASNGAFANVRYLPVYAIAAAEMIQKNNLWPVTMLLVSPVAVLYLAALFIMHRATRR